MTTLEKVRKEIVDLHDFFTAWFNGTVDKSHFDETLMKKLHPDFVMIPPEGAIVSREAMKKGFMAAHASNPAFKIQIRDVQVHHVIGSKVLATYTEWQKAARNSEPSNNARISTVLMETSPSVQWLHLQETRLPESVRSAGSFDF